MTTLTTDRLTLTPHVDADFADCATMWADATVTRHITGRPSTTEEAWARLLRYVGHWSVLGYGYWVLRDRASGRFVGEAGLADFRREIEPPFGDAPELGYVLASWAHGRGLATEAVRAVLAWADDRFPRTVSMIDPANVASIRVAEKSGYREYGRTSYKGELSILFERTR